MPLGKGGLSWSLPEVPGTTLLGACRRPWETPASGLSSRIFMEQATWHLGDTNSACRMALGAWRLAAHGVHAAWHEGETPVWLIAIVITSEQRAAPHRLHGALCMAAHGAWHGGKHLPGSSSSSELPSDEALPPSPDLRFSGRRLRCCDKCGRCVSSTPCCILSRSVVRSIDSSLDRSADERFWSWMSRRQHDSSVGSASISAYRSSSGALAA